MTKKEKLQKQLIDLLGNRTLRFRVYSEHLFYYYANCKNGNRVEFCFFCLKDKDLFTTESIENILNSVNFKKYFDLIIHI